MTDKKYTTVKISKEIHKRLEDYKIYDRETYNDAIKRALDGCEKSNNQKGGKK